MGNEKDLFEWRRFSGHWGANAAKARLAAYVLWRMLEDSRLSEMAYECGHQVGDSNIAIMEAFRRESAIALELIIKSIIVNKLQAMPVDSLTKGISLTHNLPKLWKEANLPELSREDKYRLQRMTSVLYWSGRYPVPKTVTNWENENKALDALRSPPPEPGKLSFQKPISMGWTEFDRLYQIAHSCV